MRIRSEAPVLPLGSSFISTFFPLVESELVLVGFIPQFTVSSLWVPVTSFCGRRRGPGESGSVFVLKDGLDQNV